MASKVVPIRRSPAHGGGRGNVPTSPADVGLPAWPQCAECTMRKGRWMPVEGYALVDEKPNSLTIKRRTIVNAECSHGHGMEKRHIQRQSAAIDCPYFWGEAQRLLAVKSLVFFKPGQQTDNKMVL